MKINKYITFLLVSILVVGCADKLELEPAQSLSTDKSLENFSKLQTALVGAYDGLQSVNYYGRNFVVAAETRGDNVYVSRTNSNRFLTDYNYQVTANGSTLNTFWNLGYAIILRLNNIINRAPSITDAPNEAALNKIIGEAKALRALVYFDLLRVFALPYAERTGDQDGVPLLLEATISSPVRNTQEEIYTQILADLTDAKSLILNDASGPFRMTNAGAEALMARVYLYMGNYVKAEESASNVIDDFDYELVSLEDLFSVSNTEEEIFTINRQANETMGSDNLGQIFNPQGYGDIRVATDIFDLYETGDARAELIYDSAFSPGVTEKFVGKYMGELGMPGFVSTKVIRLAELYLIRAEARARQTDYEGAVEDINIIRERASLEEIAIDPANVLEYVYDEKRREFAFEGHRSFDLWRTGKPLQRIQCGTGLEISSVCEIAATSKLRVYPIPQSEINANPNMKQNDAYVVED